MFIDVILMSVGLNRASGLTIPILIDFKIL